MNTFVLVNPVSADGSTREVWPKIAEVMAEHGLKFDHHFTTGPYQAPELVRNALKGGKTTIVSVGGDGTANEVVNGFFEGDQPINPQARLGIISRGTGCDLIRTLDIPKDYTEAVAVIARNYEHSIDLAQVEYTDTGGQLQRRYYANIADVGLGADVANRVNHSSKSGGGLWSYLQGTLATVLGHKNHIAKVEVDGEIFYEGPLVLAALANGRYFGGGMELAPQAKIDDGKLDLLLVKGMRKLAILVNFARIYKGTHLSHPKIVTVQVQNAKISGDLLLETDGEIPGTAPVQFKVVPNAIKVLC